MKCLVPVLVSLTLSNLTPAHASNDKPCPKLLAEKAHYMVGGKRLAQTIDMETFGAHLRKLTGIDPIAEGVKIADRYSVANRKAVRVYLLEKLIEAGFKEEDIRFEAEGPEERWVYDPGAESKTESDNEQKPKSKRSRRKKEYLELDHDGMVRREIPLLEREVLNIIARKPGSKNGDTFFEIAAHYDTANEGVPGADDNGSGLVTVLVAAERLAKEKTETTVDFVFCDLEERGFRGSRLHAKTLDKEDPPNFLGALVLDMFGFFPKNREGRWHYMIEVGNRSHHESTSSYESSVALANTVLDQLVSYGRNLDAKVALDNALPYTGDHGPYWQKDLPAIFISTQYDGEYINPGYHHSWDNMDGMNWPFFHAVATQIIETVSRMAGVSHEGEIPSELQPKLASNRDHLGVYIAARERQLEQERREREERLKKEKEEREERDRQREQEFQDRLRREREAREDREYSTAARDLPSHLDDWTYFNIVDKTKQWVIQRNQIGPATGVLSMLSRIFLGEETVEFPTEADFMGFGPEILRPSFGKELVTYSARDFQGGGPLAKHSENLRKVAVEWLEGPASSNALYPTYRLRIGQLVFSIDGYNSMKVTPYDPSKLKGHRGLVWATTREGVDRILMRLSHYLEFVRHRGGFYLTAPAKVQTQYEKRISVHAEGFYYDFDVTMQGEAKSAESIPVVARERDSGFILPGTRTVNLVQLDVPDSKSFGVVFLHDVLGLKDARGEMNSSLFQNVWSGEKTLDGVQFKLKYEPQAVSRPESEFLD